MNDKQYKQLMGALGIISGLLTGLNLIAIISFWILIDHVTKGG